MAKRITGQYTYDQDLAWFIVGDYRNNTWYFRQSFTVPSGITYVTSITLYVAKISTYSSGTTTVRLNGVSASRSSSGWSTGYTWRTYTFSSPVSVSAGTNYLYFTSYGGSMVGPGGYTGSSGGYVSRDGSTWGQSYTNSDNITISFKSLVFYVDGYGKPQDLGGTTVSGLTYNSATLSSSVGDDNGSSITSSGFAIGTSPSPTDKIAVSSGEGSFSTTYTNLNYGTTYYVRSYATNAAGTSYGPDTSFTTPTPVATLTSSASFTAGNSIYMTFNNPASFYVKATVFVNDGTDWEPSIATKEMGNGTSATFGFTKEEINKIYSQLGGAESRSCIIRLYTYSDSGYSNYISPYQDKLGTCTQPARATTSSNSDLTIGNNKSVVISNPSGKYVKIAYYVQREDGLFWQIKDDQAGNATSFTHTLVMSSQDNAQMYQQIPNRTSTYAIIRVLTFEHSDYTTLIRNYQDVGGTVFVNQAINKPIFTTFTLRNLDKTIDNKDKYGNTLVSSSTSTLLGADTKMIKGYSTLRVSITPENKMVAQNYANPVKYRFVSGDKYKDANYSADSTVNMDIDNAIESTASVTAYDSRNLTTTVTDTSTITNNAVYTGVSLWGLKLLRDNGVDSKTKLQISGSYWKQYFGGGTSGVLNTITAHYRYKLTTENWGSQTWKSITLTDNNGSLSYDGYIDGDLGANGFDRNKSFNIEVRAYDKLTNTIVEHILNVEIPVIDITSSGVAFMARYDTTKGGALQVLGKNLLDFFYPVGTVYTTTSSDLDTTAKMNAYFGGTWEVYGAGRVLVAKSADTEFNTIGKTGGEKTHTLTIAEMPNHNHTVIANVEGPHADKQLSYGGADANWELFPTSYTGGGGAHNNLPPYQVVYRYRRTA